jgi:hypothetical protein
MEKIAQLDSSRPPPLSSSPASATEQIAAGVGLGQHDELLESVVEEGLGSPLPRSLSVGVADPPLDYDLEVTIADDDWSQLVTGSSAAVPGRESVTAFSTADHHPSSPPSAPSRKRRRYSAKTRSSSGLSTTGLCSVAAGSDPMANGSPISKAATLVTLLGDGLPRAL